MRVILTTGGTGGHIFPALAVAEVLQAQGVDCLFVGSQYGSEAEWAARAGVEFVGLPVRGVVGRGVRAVTALAGLIFAVIKAVKLLRRYKPDVVAGFGAYASFAPLCAAVLCRVPIVLHEQNMYPGMVNKLFGRRARRVCLSMPGTRYVAPRAFPRARSVWTGNPVRAALLRVRDTDVAVPHPPRLLVVGGSQGAKAVNSVILAGLPRLIEAGVELRHQTGKQDYERVAAGYAAFGYHSAMVTPFIEDMAEAYAWADLVLCRAGATTVAELFITGKPALFIPFPYAANDHQTSNARAVCDAGAGVMITEKELAEKDAIGTLLLLLRDEDQLAIMSKAALERSRPKAAAHVARAIMKAARKQWRSAAPSERGGGPRPAPPEI